LYSSDGTSQRYVFSFTASADNTWTKITKTIPGAANVQFDLNINRGLDVSITPWYGTDYTAPLTLNQWAAFVSGVNYPDYASTWLTAGASTFDVTGVQLEVGSTATPFEHRSYGDELARCQRYYQAGSSIGAGYGSADGYARAGSIYATQMRTTPTVTFTNAGSGSIVASGTSDTGFYVTYGSLAGTTAGIFSYTAEAEI
jgi:hypothetical protein